MLPSAIIALLLGALAVALVQLNRERTLRKQQGLLGPWPIGKQSLEEIFPQFAAGLLGPDRSLEIRFIGAHKVAGGISDMETWILCNATKTAKNIFEFGTCTGKTTFLLAANAPQAHIWTLTLPLAQTGHYADVAGDDPRAKDAALAESRFKTFYYENTPEQARISQLFGDSKLFDESPYLGRMDIVFVDGAHARSYVESDSAKALKMVRPGGLVFWHDYRGPRRARGVYEALNELSRTLPLVHIAGTSLVVYKAPAAPGKAA